MATITSLNASDAGSVSRGVINTNFSNLNSDKAETSALSSYLNKSTETLDNITAGTTNKHLTATLESKLNGIEAGADVTDATNVAAAGAVMNTGNETIAGIKTFSSSPIVPAPTTDLQAATKKYVDDNSGGAPEGTAVKSTGETGGSKFLREDGDGTCSWQAVSAGTDNDAIHDNVSGEISAITAKTTPADSDVTVIEDSAASNAKKSLSWANIKATLKTYFDTLYGNVAGQASSVDNEVALFSGTGGKTIKRAAGTGYAFLSDGVLSYVGSTVLATISGTQTLTNKTLTSPKINEDVALTATATELNVLDGIPATLTATELGYVDGVTSAIQTQLNAKAPIASPSFTGTVTLPTGLTGILRADSGVVSTDSDVTDIVSAASDTAAGKVELATSSETTTGTDTGRAVTPDGLAGSTIFGAKTVQIMVFEQATDWATGDGKAYFVVPQALNGMNLVRVHARVITAGTTGTSDIQLRNVTDSQDMLSTKLTIDSGETGSDTAATASVINTAYDDVATNDLIAIDIDATATTKPKGLICTLEFQLP